MKKSIFKKITAIATCAAMIIPTFTMQNISARAAEIETPEDIVITEEYDASLLNAISNMADYYLNSNSFGASINYSTYWYSGLSTVEILARMIYAECPIGTSAYGPNGYYNEQKAVSWVIINRRNSGLSYFGTTYYGIATSGHFSSITGGSAATANAREPETSYSCWGDAVWLACALTMTSSVSNYEWLIPKPIGIDSQLSFYASSLASFGQGYNYLTINGFDATNIAYAGNGKVYSVYEMISGASSYKNIYFSCVGDLINMG